MRSLRAEEVSHLEEVEQQVRVVSGAAVEPRLTASAGARQSVGQLLLEQHQAKFSNSSERAPSRSAIRPTV